MSFQNVWSVPCMWFSITLLREVTLLGIVSLKSCNYIALCRCQVKPDGLWPGTDASKAWNNAKGNAMKVKKFRCAVF